MGAADSRYSSFHASCMLRAQGAAGRLLAQGSCECRLVESSIGVCCAPDSSGQLWTPTPAGVAGKLRAQGGQRE